MLAKQRIVVLVLISLVFLLILYAFYAALASHHMLKKSITRQVTDKMLKRYEMFLHTKLVKIKYFVSNLKSTFIPASTTFIDPEIHSVVSPGEPVFSQSVVYPIYLDYSTLDLLNNKVKPHIKHLINKYFPLFNEFYKAYYSNVADFIYFYHPKGFAIFYPNSQLRNLISKPVGKDGCKTLKKEGKILVLYQAKWREGKIVAIINASRDIKLLSFLMGSPLQSATQDNKIKITAKNCKIKVLGNIKYLPGSIKVHPTNIYLILLVTTFLLAAVIFLMLKWPSKQKTESKSSG